MEKEKKETPKDEGISKKEIALYLIIIVAILLLKKFVVTPILVSGDSMKKTLLDNDILILNKLAYVTGDIERFDVVVVDTENEYIIKRIIGLPGEKISYIDNREVSVDSRILGPFSKKEILGKSNLVIFPFKRFGIKN